MRPPQHDWYPERDRWSPEPKSDTWLLIDAIVTILVATVTIVVVVIRHPIMTLTILIVVGMIGAVAGWW